MKQAPQPIGPLQRRMAIAILVFAAYWPMLRMGFLWDDHVMIEANASIRHWSLQNVRDDFSTDPFSGQGDAYYRPLQTMTNRLDYTVWGLNPFGYHLTNLLFHLANSILIGELVFALGFGPLVALVTGCLFGVHPIGVEQLMIIAGRAELMTLCFTLINLLFFLENDPWALAAGTAAYALALLSKENAIITPGLFLLVSWYRKDKKPIGRRLVLYLAVTFPYLLARSYAIGARLPAIDPRYALQFYIQAFAKIAAIYARLILIPWNLHSHRLAPHLSHFWFLFLVGWVGLFFWTKQKKARWGLLSIGWFLLCLLPKTPAIITGNFMLDHWAYPAAIGIILPLAVGFSWCWEHQKRQWHYWLAIALFPVLIGWALLVHLNVALRGTDEKMYRWALHFTSSHPIKYNLGILLLQSGRPNESLEYFQDVLFAYPDDMAAQHALAIAYWQLGHKKAAIYMLHKILLVAPDNAPAQQSLKKIQAEMQHGPIKK